MKKVFPTASYNLLCQYARLKGNLLQKQLWYEEREVALLKYFLKCGHRQDIVKFPHHIQNHLQVNFVMGHHCPLHCSSL